MRNRDTETWHLRRLGGIEMEVDPVQEMETS